MHWQHHLFVAPVPEEETPLPAAWPEAPPKAAAASATAATAATTATTGSQQPTAHSQQPTANRQQPTSTAGGPGGIEPETFWIWGGLGGFGGRSACGLCLCSWWGGGVFFGRSKKPSNRHYQPQLQTSHPSPSWASLDTPARPADSGDSSPKSNAGCAGTEARPSLDLVTSPLLHCNFARFLPVPSDDCTHWDSARTSNKNWACWVSLF